MKNKSVISRYKGLTFAEAAEKIDKKYNNRTIDNVAANSYEVEMKELAKANEIVKIKNQVANFKAQPNFSTNNENIEGAFSLNLDTLNNVPLENPFDNMVNRFSDHNMINPLAQRTINPTSQNPNNNLQTSNINIAPDTAEDKLNYMLSKTGAKIGEGAKKVGDWYKNDPYAPAYTGAAVSGLTNALILAQGYDKVPPRFNTEANDVKRLMQERTINMDSLRQDLASNRNAALQSTEGLRSNSVRMAAQQGIHNNMNDAIGKLGLQEQQINNQFKGEYANVLNSIGQQNAQASAISDDLTARNKGQYLSNVSAFAASIGENSKFLTKQKLQDNMNKFMIDVLNKQNVNVKISDDFFSKFKSGKLSDSDWIKLNLGQEEVDSLKDLYDMSIKNKDKPNK